MRKYVLATSAAAAAALASPAVAQDTDRGFTGPYVGVLAGWEKTQAGSSVDDDINPNNDQSIDGIMYGVTAGYDMDFGSVVAGVEAELSDSSAKTSVDGEDFEGFGYGSVKTNRDLYLGARVGFKATPNTLVYAKGGYTNAKFDALARNNDQELRRDLDLDGWRAGAGVEQKFGKRTFARLEYRYSKYKEAEIDFPEDGVPDTGRFDVDTDRHQVVAAVGLRF